MNLRKKMLLLACLCTSLYAQEKSKTRLSFEARADYHREVIDKNLDYNNTGFKGNIFNIVLQGDINDKFSYKYRQRLNGINKEYSFFDAIDWLFLTYHATPSLTLSAGKWAVLTGPWEMDPAPIDCFQLFEFCYTFPCYQWGVWMGYQTKDKKDQYFLQMVDSPFRRIYQRRSGKGAEMYAYNLIWYGHHGAYHADWSCNFMEYAPGKFINYLTFGNSFDITNNLRLGIDYMNRDVASQSSFIFKDYSVSARIDYQPSKKVKLWAKASFDTNKAGVDSPTDIVDAKAKTLPERADLAVYEGTEITRLGVGAEYYPLGTQKIRIHGNYSYAFGKNTNPNGYLVDKKSMLDLGITWRVDIIK